MCNEFAQERAWREYSEMMQREALKIVTPEQPDLPLASIRPSEQALVVSAARDGVALDLLPWGWKKADGKGLVLWMQGEKRRDPPAARGVVPLTKFYEFRGDKPPKEKWEFRAAINEPIGMAVARQQDGRWAHLTTEPGPDVSVIHKRQPAILRLSDWKRFLTQPEWPGDLVVPSPAGALKAVQVR